MKETNIKYFIDQCIGKLEGKRIYLVCNKSLKDFFSKLKLIMEANGAEVLLDIKEKRNIESHWLPKIIRNGLLFIEKVGPYECNLIIIGTPIEVEKQEAAKLHEQMILYENLGMSMILLDWPIKKVPIQYQSSASKLYEKSLTINYNEMRKLNFEIEKILRQGTEFTITNASGTFVTFNRSDNKIFKEDCNLEYEKIFQLPGGEVFFVPEPTTTNGVIILSKKSPIEKIEISNGYAYFPKKFNIPFKVPVAEFGIGTNFNFAPIEYFTSSEKSFKSCHFGFGHNKNFGGIYNENYHFDILIKKFKMYIDGKPISLPSR